MSSWRISGQYMETCNCAFLCPCIVSNLAATPTEGDCKAAIGMRIDQGEKEGVSLDGLSFVVMLHSPGAMAEGNITVGLIVDETASSAQVEAITAIATGAVGGPMAALGPLVGRMAGVERSAITFNSNGIDFSMRAGELVDQACEGIASGSAPGEALAIDNTVHPVNSRLSLAKATKSRFNVFGMNWDDSSGTRNGHFAPFAWSG
jgi:hypothetical protein